MKQLNSNLILLEFRKKCSVKHHYQPEYKLFSDSPLCLHEHRPWTCFSIVFLHILTLVKVITRASCFLNGPAPNVEILDPVHRESQAN